MTNNDNADKVKEIAVVVPEEDYQKLSDERKLQMIQDYQNLPPEMRADIDAIIDEIDIEDSQSVIQYGIKSQKKISAFADTILSHIRSKDSGKAGEALAGLMLRIRELNVDKLSAKPGGMSRVPIVGGLFNKAKKFAAKYQKMNIQIEKITDDLDSSRMQLLKDITMLDRLYERNLDYFEELNKYIIAGHLKLHDAHTNLLPQLTDAAMNSANPIEGQRLNDTKQSLVRFEKKLHDLKLSRTIALQTAPQIRLIQHNNQTLVEKIQSSLINTIPLWKNQVVLAITLFKQQKAVRLQQDVANTTNSLLRKNSEMLKSTSIDVARETERGIVDIETLKKVNNDLLTTIEETLKIQQDGRSKRLVAETELVRIEEELKRKLANDS